MIDGTTVIDFHGHPGRWGSLDNRAETVLRAMDAVGIDRACVFDIHHSDGRTANDRTAGDGIRGARSIVRLCLRIAPDAGAYGSGARARDRPAGYARDQAVSVLRQHQSERARVVSDLRIRQRPWLGHHHPYRYRANHLTAFSGRGWRPRFPKAIFVAGHSGNVAPIRRQAIDAARGNENVYLETCSTFRTPGVIEQLVAEAGAERILFGSDAPLMDPRSQLGKIITADIDEDTKRMILGMNAQRILGL